MSEVNTEKKLFLSSSPHFSSGLNAQIIMGMVLVSLIPEIIAGTVIFGPVVLLKVLVSVVSCVFFEFIFQKATKQKILISNLSACVTGVLLALVCSPAIPVWMLVLGAAVAMIIAKGLFGGIGSNVFNPALTGRAFLFISFPAVMGAKWIIPHEFDAISSATVLSQIKAGTFALENDTLLQLFLGNKSGCMGETSILAILISLVFLLALRIIDWRAPLAMVCTVFAGVFLVNIGNGFETACMQGLLALLTGGLLFGAVFMVTDYATTPVTKKGKLIFGFGCGLITFLIRQFGSYPEGVMFSILIMNSVAPFLNNLTDRMYGYGKINKKLEASK